MYRWRVAEKRQKRDLTPCPEINMLPISVPSDLAKLSVEGGSARKLAEVCRMARTRMLQSRDMRTPRQARIDARSPLLFLVVISLLTCGNVASAQTPPSQVIAYQDSLGVFINYWHCATSTNQNCDANFGLYRSPNPGFNQPPVKICWSASGNNTFDQCKDDTAQAGQTYTYKLCTGGAALSDGSNCATSNAVTVPLPAPPPALPTVSLKAAATSITKGQETDLNWTSTSATSLDLQPGVGKVGTAGTAVVAPAQTTTYTLTATGPGGKATANVTINVPCLAPWAPPGNVTGVSGLSDVPLKWTNPNTSAGQTCPAPPAQVLIYRMGSNGWQQLAALDKATNNGILPNHYTDSTLLQPHLGYEYAVCEGGSPNWQAPVNCASPHGIATNGNIVTWGADPVLSASRVGANTVKLQLALDQYTVTSIVVTRQASDDPCRQGGTLGNGLQGCPTPTIGPNGVGTNPSVTVYNWNASPGSQYPPGFQNSQSAPFVINLPDDTTVKPGVEYYYLAQVTWLSSVGQDSNTVTVPNAYATATLQQGLVGGGKPIKLKGNAPPSPTQSKAATTMISPTSRTITPAPSSPMMAPAGSPTAAPPQQMTATRPAVAPMITAAPPMLQPGRPMISSTVPSSAPLLGQPVTAATPAIAPVNAPMPPLRSSQVLPSPANLNAGVKQLQQRPHDAQALYALGEAYCASNLRNTGVSYMYMALLLAEQAGNAPLAAQIKTSLAQQGVSAK